MGKGGKIIKTLVKTKEKNELRIEYRDIPQLNEDELLIKVKYCGICGSDLHIANDADGYEFVPRPIILGHEFSGTVARIGSVEHNEFLNKRVVVIPSETCGQCEQCKAGRESICLNISGVGLHTDGGMAEYAVVKLNQIIAISDELPFEIAALTEPLSVAVHAVDRITDNLSNKNVLVQGCGVIGMFTAIVAKDKGANVTISGLASDWEHRLRLAKIFDIETLISEENNDDSANYDYIFECSGSSNATETAVNKIKKGGIFVIVAIYEEEGKLPLNIFVRGEIDILSSYSSTIRDFNHSLEMLNANKENFKQLIKTYSLDDATQAFLDARNQKVLKPVLKI